MNQDTTAETLAKIESQELKPCPFCGGTAEVSLVGGEEGGIYVDRIGVFCEACEFHLAGKCQKDEDWPWETRRQAIDKWNNQALAAEASSQREVIRVLREAVEHYGNEANWDWYGDSQTIYRHGQITETAGPDKATAALERVKEVKDAS